MKAKFKEAATVEAQMTALKNDKYDALIVPNTFFCTFAQGKSHTRALETKKVVIDGFPVEFKPAKGPSDTIWLNKGVSYTTKLARGLIVCLGGAIVVFVTYILFQNAI